MKDEKNRMNKSGSTVTRVSNNVVPNQLQSDMQSNTVPGIKPTLKVITTCDYSMNK